MAVSEGPTELDPSGLDECAEAWARPTVSPYCELEYVAGRVEKGKHRIVIGGAWEAIGQLQSDYLRDLHAH